MSSSPKTCTMCGSKIKLFPKTHLNRTFCFNCFSYVSIYCKTPEDLERWTIDELKAKHGTFDCDLCGKNAKTTQRTDLADGMIYKECEKLLRPQYKKTAGAIATTTAANIIGTAVEVAFDSPGAMGFTSADDPLNKVTLVEVKEVYEKLKTEKTE